MLITAAPGRLTPVLGDPTPAHRNTARSLLIRGRAELAAGDAEAALEAFQAAHAILGVPTTGIDVARAQLALGLLVEARDTALEVMRFPVGPGEPAAFTDARTADAEMAGKLAVQMHR